MIWSRRAFLGRSGLAVVAARIGWTRPVQTFPARVFGLAAVHDVPHGTIVGHLAPESVHNVREAGGWFITEHGYVSKVDMQPIAQYVAPQIEHTVQEPFWAELIAPSSVVRAFASGRAPMLETLGYGAVVRVIDVLTDDRGDTWYETEFGGWIMASHVLRLTICLTPGPSPQAERGDRATPDSPSPFMERGLGRKANSRIPYRLHLQINLRQLTMRLYDQRRLILQTPFYGGANLAAHVNTLRIVQPGGEHGAPWQMMFESGTKVYGAYWHNRFGLKGDEPDLQLPISAAKKIYTVLNAVIGETRCTVEFV